MMRKILIIAFISWSFIAFAQEQESDTTNLTAEQDRASMAVDATATQWSFQFAYQSMPQYYDDIVNGVPRPAGMDDYLQLRIVAPVLMKNKKMELPTRCIIACTLLACNSRDQS